MREPASIDVAACDSRPPHTILHVTESFASGTASAVADVVRNYPDAAHHLVFATKEAASVDPRELTRFVTAREMPSGHLARLRFLRRLLDAADGVTHIHAHSSKAGIYVRAAARRSDGRRIVYTPHCYAFERLDVPWLTRSAFRAAEWLLSFNTSAYGACSAREATLSRWPISAPLVVLLPNVMPPGLPRSRSTPAGGLRIVGNGRLGPQKDPSFFAAAFRAAKAKHPNLEGLWVGGGDEHYVRELQDSGVEVTGWLTRTDALAAMAACDVYLHTALWEGFPISIMEAAGMGLPVISRRRPFLAGVDLPMLMDRPEELTTLIDLLGDPAELAALRTATRIALDDNTDKHQRAALHTLYETAGSVGRR